MAPVPGEPRQGHKPQPLGNFPFIVLFTVCTLCAVFLLWRRASTLRIVVAHQLTTWTRKDGRIRLSEDDGPPAHEFLSDDFDEDPTRIADDEPLALDVDANAPAKSSVEAAEPERSLVEFEEQESPSPKSS